MWLLMRLMPAFRKRLTLAAEAARSDRPIQLAQAWEAGQRQALAAKTLALRQTDVSALSDANLQAHLRASIRNLNQAARHHFELDFASVFIVLGRLGALVGDPCRLERA